MALPALAADWPAPSNIRALTTLRHGLGVSMAPFDHFNLGGHQGGAGDNSAAVEKNRTLLVEHGHLPSTPRWLRQVHGVEVVKFEADIALASTLADGQEQSSELQADACVTCDRDVVLAVLTADCLPVLFCSEVGDEVGAAHAGWRGLAGGVLEATVATMRSPAARLLAWLGPAAGPAVYEIGVEVREAFLARDARAAEAFMPTRPGHWRVDLYTLARQRLATAGVHRVFGGGLCTISDPQRFFSHRREQPTGRMASLIWMQNDCRN